MSESRCSQWAVNCMVNTVKAKHGSFSLFFKYGDILWFLLVALQQGRKK